MTDINYNALTGETSFEDIEILTENIVEVPTESERLMALEDTMLAMLLGGITNG